MRDGATPGSAGGHTSMMVIGWLGGTKIPRLKSTGSVLSVSRETSVAWLSDSTLGPVSNGG